MINTKNFIRVTENFTCAVCGQKVKGNGYTDHCPECLWGKHVDKLIPGDRSSDCLGLMEPIWAEFCQNQWRVGYKCCNCNHIFSVKAAQQDNKEKLFSLLKLKEGQ